MEVHILHDPRRPEKMGQMMAECNAQGITDYEIWFGHPESGFEAKITINRMHKQIVQYAKGNNLEEICIMEDDVHFPAKDGWEYFLNRKPPFEYNLYLGGHYGDVVPITKAPYLNLASCARPNGLHCYIIHQRFYDTFLATPDDVHIDDAQTEQPLYVCFPFAAVQRAGWSANAKSIVDYNHDIRKKKWVYGW